MSPPQPARTLLVLRHAKAAGQPGVNDHERPLAPRGRRDAPAAGAWLRDAGLAPDIVLCSSARRTQETWELVGETLGGGAGSARVSFERRIYDAGPGGLLALVNDQPDDAATVLVVGHNPACHQLAVDLTGASSLEFPTCALAVIAVPGGWAELATGAAALARFWSPHQPD